MNKLTFDQIRYTNYEQFLAFIAGFDINPNAKLACFRMLYGDEQWYTQGDIQEALKLKKRTVRQILYRMIDAGLAEREFEGPISGEPRYRLLVTTDPDGTLRLMNELERKLKSR